MREKIPTFLRITAVGLVLSILYFVSRLINFTNIPIFTDEAIYLRWAQIAEGDPRWRFISLIDGKQPLLIWLQMIGFKISTMDPLVMGRLISIICGFIAMCGFCVMGYIRTKRITGAWLGVVFYIVLPFFLMYDRMAIYEALFVAITIWSLIFIYLTGKTLRLDFALIAGMSVGLGLLTKSYANFFLILLPSMLLLSPISKKNYLKTILKISSLALIIFVQSYIYQSVMRLSEFRHIVAQKNLQFIYSFSEIVADPFKNIVGNITGLSGWLVTYMTWPVVIFCLASIYTSWKKTKRETLFFGLWFVVPFLALSVFGKVIYPRFLLFMFVPLVVLMTSFANELYTKFIQRREILLGVSLLVLGLAVRFDYLLLTAPIYAPLPFADRQQFINDWPAGYGINEVVSYISKEAEKGPVILGTEGTFGLYPHALELYLGQNTNVTTKAFWPLNEMPQELLIDAKTKPTFVVFKERQDVPKEWPLTLINQYQRGDGPTYLKFYQVTP